MLNLIKNPETVKNKIKQLPIQWWAWGFTFFVSSVSYYVIVFSFLRMYIYWKGRCFRWYIESNAINNLIFFILNTSHLRVFLMSFECGQWWLSQFFINVIFIEKNGQRDHFHLNSFASHLVPDVLSSNSNIYLTLMKERYFLS